MDLALRYERLLGWIVGLCPAPDKFAHTYAGLAIWLGAALLLRRPLRSSIPLGSVILAEILNEGIDRVAHGTWNWWDTLGDAAATWFWPAVLTIALRYREHLRR